jgi:hypothetical protein
VNSLCLPEQVAAYLEQNSSGGKPSVPLNLTGTVLSGLHSDRTKAFYRPFPSGTETLKISTDDPGKELLTWFLEVSRVRTSQPPILKLKELPVRVQDSGRKCGESFAKWNHVLCSWKTRQCSLAGGLESFSQPWPRWGMMRSGESWALMTSVHFTGERGCSSWATTTVHGNHNKVGMTEKSGDGLSTQVKLAQWTTPIERDWKDSPGMSQETEDRTRLDTLPRQVFAFWPTVLARDYFPPHKQEYIDKKKAEGHGMSNLNDTVSLWPTPVASTGGPNTNSASVKERGHGNNLVGMVKLWKTPTVACATGGQKTRGGERQDELLLGGEVQIAFGEMSNSSTAKTESSGQLSPDFTEWLQGFPIGWTASAPLEIHRYQQWLPQSIKFCPNK